MSVLDKILAHKREEVAQRKKVLPRGKLEKMAWYGEPCHSLGKALRGKELAVIGH